MKKMILLLSLIASSTFAGNGVERHEIDFSNAGPMHRDVQARLSALLHQRCQPALRNARSAQVGPVMISQEVIDQGVIDYTYTAQVTFGEPAQNRGAAEITLKRFASDNPTVDNIQLLRLDSNGACN